MPAQQHFAADHRTFAVERRHIDQAQLVVAVERAQLLFDQADALVALCEFATEGHHRVLAFGLGLIHRGIGTGQQLGDGIRVVRVAGGADAQSHRVEPILEAEAATTQPQQCLAQLFQICSAGLGQQQDGELVA